MFARLPCSAGGAERRFANLNDRFARKICNHSRLNLIYRSKLAAWTTRKIKVKENWKKSYI